MAIPRFEDALGRSEATRLVVTRGAIFEFLDTLSVRPVIRYKKAVKPVGIARYINSLSFRVVMSTKTTYCNLTYLEKACNLRTSTTTTNHICWLCNQPMRNSELARYESMSVTNTS